MNDRKRFARREKKLFSYSLPGSSHLHHKVVVVSQEEREREREVRETEDEEKKLDPFISRSAHLGQAY